MTRRTNNHCTLLLGIACIICLQICLSYGVNHYCYMTSYKSSYDTTACGLFLWGRCPAYRKVTFQYRICCTGYGGDECTAPICGGGTSSTSCRRYEGRQIYQTLENTRIVTNSGGRCVAPSTCKDCNYGYYPSNDGYCRACRQIPNCHLKSCTTYTDTVCDRCDGEWQREVPGRNAFTGKPDKTKCQRACSWRDGSRCFPGACAGDMVYETECHCADGFGGPNCDIGTSSGQASTETMKLMLQGNDYGSFKTVALDISSYQGKVWTNYGEWEIMSVSVRTSFKPNIYEPHIPPYIIFYKIGMGSLHVEAHLNRGLTSASIRIDRDCRFMERCSASPNNMPLQSMVWSELLRRAYPTPFVHRDTITFSLAATTGGYVNYTDWDERKNKSYHIIGYTRTNMLELGFDFVQPHHCYMEPPISSCAEQPLQIQDYNKDKQVNVSWGDWFDSDSGMHLVVLNVYRLVANETMLEYAESLPEMRISYTQNTTSLTLGVLGPYAVEATFLDWAGNYKTARRIVLLDDASKVDLQGDPISVKETNERRWVNTHTAALTLAWNGRFINENHHKNNWLAMVPTKPGIPRELDDIYPETTYGRTISALHNINGTVRVDIAYRVEFLGQSIFTTYETVTRGEFDQQQKIFTNMELIDGKRITFLVRGVDCMDEFAEDKVAVTVDFSPPVISNFMRNMSGLLGLSVNGALELQKLTIDWELHDHHSGISEVTWKLFDSINGTTLDRGKESDLNATETQQECEDLYGVFSRESRRNCYCSPYDGCYHRLYQVKPQVVKSESNDYDYVFEVEVINNAGLKTVRRQQLDQIRQYGEI